MTIPDPGEDRIGRPEADHAVRPLSRKPRFPRAGRSGLHRLISAMLMIALVAPVVGLVAEATASGSDLALP